jgi:nucleoside-diphosphate-sugar epimerase
VPTPHAAAPTLVTGASGFVGRHIVQQLCNGGNRVRALVRRVPKPEFDSSVEVVIGDLSQPETYTPALHGASAVVHAALTDNLSDEPQATSTLFTLSAQAGVRKFVHLSSIAVYGNPLDDTVTEETAPIPSSDAYSRTKLAIEEALKATSAGRATSTALEISVLRLGCVYGPGGGWWTEGLLNQMRHGKLILVNEGTGIANLVHVSDVAGLVALVLKRSAAPFEVFNVTDGQPVAWNRYFQELEKLLGRKATISMSAAEARDFARNWARPSLARRVIRKISGGLVIYPLDERGIENFASRAVYSNAKAATLLHFVPQYNLESGMRTIESMPSSRPVSALAAQ